MPRLRHTVEEILPKLREAEVALSKRQSVAQACRTLGITEQTYYPAAVPGWTDLLATPPGCWKGE